MLVLLWRSLSRLGLDHLSIMKASAWLEALSSGLASLGGYLVDIIALDLAFDPSFMDLV